MLSLRALNRALLARQFLLGRTTLPTQAVLTRVCGLQAQTPQSPYVALWSRMKDFDPAAASALLARKQTVRLTAMRGTVHLMTVADAAAWRPLLQDKLARMLAAQAFGKAVKRMDVGALVAHVRALVEAEPRTLADLRPLLKERFPGRDPTSMSWAAYSLTALVQLPPRGLWKGSGNPVLTTFEAWTKKRLAPRPSLERLVLRYLRGFGPATVADLQAWSGLSKLKEVVDGLGKKVRWFGAYVDVPEGERPDEDTPAPVRFFPDYENAILGYADRARILRPDAKPPASANGVTPGTFTVDGWVAGLWTLRNGTLRVKPFRRPAPAARRAIDEEAHALGTFLGATRS